MTQLIRIAFVSMFTAMALVVAGAAPAAADTPAAKPPADLARDDIKATFGFVPGFLKAVPDRTLPGAWMEFKALQVNPRTALRSELKDLIGLAVASQIPCRYCIYAHTRFAKLAGATDVKIGEAVTIAALARHWSTVLNGAQIDEAAFRKDIAKVVEHVRKAMAGKVPPPKMMAVTDAASARTDIQQYFGFYPEFFKHVPDGALPGAWIEMRDVELNPETALNDKDKSLISLAVAAQIPCRYCVVADTEFARLSGATEAEIDEAIAVAALVRHWSTLLNGLQVDEPTFRKDIDRLVKGAEKAMAKAPKK